MKKLFKLMKQNKSCVLLKKDLPPEEPHQVKYFVRDIENDIIYSGYDYTKACEVFEGYDIEKVRKEREKVFNDWLEEYVDA